MWPSNLLLLALIVAQGSLAKESPSPEEIEEWAQTVDDKLRNENYLFDIVKMIYTNKANAPSNSDPDVSMTYEKIDEVKLVLDMAASLSAMLQRKMDALSLSVKKAEEVAALHKWNKSLEKDDVHYINAKEILSNGMDLTYVDRFKTGVNLSTSSVHIPVEIFDGNIDILNGLNWSTSLEEQFKKNYEADPEILWQYFGSQTGFMRTYPAAPWPRDGVDLYDVRRQSWYTQGSSSPKDMMILVDTSGSTHGQSLQLMQNAVKSILDTLGENDFVNIVSFAEKASFVSKCLNHTAFVQANIRNKKQLERDVDRLTALGQADFSEAIRFAFEKFDEFSSNKTNDENNIGANCNKVMMLLTDGGTDTAQDVFEKNNWPNKTVRVFTYAVGPTPNPIHAVRWMACANRGYFSQIPAMGAIRARVQGYTEYLKATLESYGVQDEMWEVTLDPRGLGMMTTVTLPVYNRSVASSNQTILGVMGVDVTTAQLEARTPFSKIGPNGYSFAINPNGYVVFHPNLKTGGKFMKEPPNIDIMDLEIHQPEREDEIGELRSAMIVGKTDKMTISTLFLSPDQRYVTESQANYAFTQIENTTFRLGISVPLYQKKYSNFNGDIKLFDWSHLDSDLFSILIAPWDYFKNMSQVDDLTGTIEDVRKLLKTNDDPDEWNLDLLYHLYWDTQRVEPSLIDFLKNNITHSENDSDTDVFNDLDAERKEKMSYFIMTNGGMTLVSPKSEVKYFESMRDVRTSSLYKRALHSPSCIFMADYTEVKRANTSATPLVTMACGISIKQKNELQQETVIDKPVVVGARMTHTKIMDIVNNGVREVTDRINNRRTGQDVNFAGLKTCEDETSLLCYLVDDGGFLVATNREEYREEIGRFFGQIDPPIMRELLNDSIFLTTVQYDFQASCFKQDDTFSAGIRGYQIPSVSLLFEVLNIGWWTSKVSWAYSSFNFFSWLFSPSTEIYAQEASGSENPCVKSIQQFYLRQGLKSTSKMIGGDTCTNCTRNYTVVKMNYTNLLFIVTEPHCEGCDEVSPIAQAPREVLEKEQEEIICELAQNPRKRLLPYGCYHADAREDSSECGCSTLRISSLAFLVVLVSTLWKWMVAAR